MQDDEQSLVGNERVRNNRIERRRGSPILREIKRAAEKASTERKATTKERRLFEMKK